MPDLKQAINILVITILVLAMMLLGDYMGYKFGRMKLLASVGIIALALVIVYAIYSFTVLVLLG
ncbi:MAG: hypothetical protein Q7J73_06410 [Dehalococcoidales bacterium]|nr:hypothetical protein [Dehalococcoidales bacterium]